MTHFSEHFKLGYFKKVTGLKGELILILDTDNPGHYKKLNTLFIEINSGMVPFFINTIRIAGKTATILLDGITTESQAKKLVGKSVYLPLNMLPPVKGKKFYFHEVIGFSVTDKRYGNIGIIESMIENPKQAIFQIRKDSTEILVPAIDPFIESINREKKEIIVNTPEGLLDIYLNPNSTKDEEE